MSTQAFDTTRKFVRVIEIRNNGMVEFEFAIGEPSLFVELLLPSAAFAEFCSTNAVTMLEPQASGEVSQWDWRLRQATHQRFR